MDDDFQHLTAIDKLHDVARFIELHYNDTGLQDLMRLCADELMALRNNKKQAKITTENLIKKIKLNQIKKL